MEHVSISSGKCRHNNTCKITTDGSAIIQDTVDINSPSKRSPSSNYVTKVVRQIPGRNSKTCILTGSFEVYLDAPQLDIPNPGLGD